MLVYQDIFTSDEVISDSFKQNPVVDDAGNTIPGLFEVESKIVAKGGDNIDIGCGDAFGGGDAEEGVDDSVEKVNNIIDENLGFGYIQVYYNSKTELKEYLKAYFVNLRKHKKDAGVAQEEIKKFMGEAAEIVKFFLGKFKDLDFYMFRSMNAEAGHAFSYYKEGALAPTFAYISAGLNEVKF